jgi:hypothetical protein
VIKVVVGVVVVVLEAGWAGTVRYSCCFLLFLPLWAILGLGGVLSCTWNALIACSVFLCYTVIRLVI